jgi:hypothetical protein
MRSSAPHATEDRIPFALPSQGLRRGLSIFDGRRVTNVPFDQLKAAKRREELGITSLGVIMLVAAYMEAKGVPQVGFRPEWVPRLDSIEGLMSVFGDIRREGAASGR